MLPRGYGAYARRHNLGHITPIQYAPFLVILRIFNCSFHNLFDNFNRSSTFVVRRCPQVDIKEFAFLEFFISKTQPEERTWVKLVTLKTIHWYCDGLEPTLAAVKYKIRRRKFVDSILKRSLFLFCLLTLSVLFFKNGRC